MVVVIVANKIIIYLRYPSFSREVSGLKSQLRERYIDLPSWNIMNIMLKQESIFFNEFVK